MCIGFVVVVDVCFFVCLLAVSGVNYRATLSCCTFQYYGHKITNHHQHPSNNIFMLFTFICIHLVSKRF